jgi:hypothetical protein
LEDHVKRLFLLLEVVQIESLLHTEIYILSNNDIFHSRCHFTAECDDDDTSYFLNYIVIDSASNVVAGDARAGLHVTVFIINKCVPGAEFKSDYPV